MRPRRHHRPLIGTAAALCGTAVLAVPALAGAVSAPPAGATLAAHQNGSPSASAADRPVLRVVAASRTVELPRYRGRVYLDLGVYAEAGNQPFEIRANRSSYADPITARQIVGGTEVDLPPGLLKDFSGFPGFFHVTLTDSDDTTAYDQYQRFCPNGYGVRARPGAPSTSPYPGDCPAQPFTLGSVWGIQAGWANTITDYNVRPPKLARGTYTATVTVAKRYRDLLDISAADGTATLTLRVVKSGDCKAGCVAAPPEQGNGPSPRPAGHEPGRRPKVPSGVPLPDLRSLPAYGIQVTHKHFLAFSATVWNAGPSTLVVDGFRRNQQDLMDAYQYFYNAAGHQVGHAPVGTMEWDARPGHEHWHFTDFARYRLLDADKTAVVRSHKEAFCLAATDAVDYTVPGADWQPFNTDLQTACGDHSAIGVREVLETGNGDTYEQWRPGQSFNLADLPNGTYYIEVASNPQDRLYEADTTNNVSYRKIVLGGSPDARTVRVPPVGLVDAP